MLRLCASLLPLAFLSLGLETQGRSCSALEQLEDEVSLLQHKAELPSDGATVPLFSALRSKADKNRTQAAFLQLQLRERSVTGINLADPQDWGVLRREARAAASNVCLDRGRLVFIGILSAPHNLYRRNLARTVFLNDFHEAGFDHCIKVRFIIGHEEFSTSHQGQTATPEQMQTEKEMEEEQRRYGDVVRVPVPESYKSLPDKVLALLSVSLAENFDFVAKVDDDMVPDLSTMLPLITGVDADTFLYSGRYLWSSMRYNSQLGANKDFAPYFGGPTYLLSHALAHQILVEDGQLTFQFLSYGSKSEDIDMGKWVQMAHTLSGKQVQYRQAHLSYELCGPGGCQRAGYDNMARE